MPLRPVYHPWNKLKGALGTYSRTLTAPEEVLALLNEYAQGQSGAYLGLTVSVDHTSPSAFSVKDLKSRLENAFTATRWKHPTVATQVKENKSLAYHVHDADGVAAWSKRTVRWAELERGWRAKHEQLSRGSVLPTETGDCAQLHLVLSPQQATQAQVTKFDLLLHAHHTLIDGAGLRSVVNTVLAELANPTPPNAFSWGEEAPRLEPSALDAAVISDESINSLAQMPKEITLPPLVEAAGARQGTGVVNHTFKKTGFLNDLKSIARANDAKLAATIQAALVTVLYERVKPTEEEFATVISGVDLRKRDLAEPWGERNRFVGYAVGLLEIVRTPVSLLEGTADRKERFWAVVKQIQKEWSGIAERRDVAAAGELRRPATGFILGKALAGANMSSSKLDLTLNYVSDPPGSDQLDGVYQGDQATFKVDDWQLVSDESTPKLSCRSHSWNDELTLSISFSHKHHTKEAVHEILEEWACMLESLWKES